MIVGLPGGKVSQEKVERLESLQVTDTEQKKRNWGIFSPKLCVQGRFDLVVNCAGLGARFKPFHFVKDC